MSKIEKNNGIKFQVMHEDIECLTVIVNTKVSKYMTGYGLIAKDLKQCLSCIDEIRKINDNNNDIFHWALYVAFHTTYGKCFASAQGRKIKLEAKDYVPIDFRKAHEKIMILRNKYTAHAGGYEEKGVAAIGLNPDMDDKKILEVMPPICLHISHISERDMGIYERLIKSIIDKVEVKIEDKRKRLQEEVSNMDIEELYNVANKF
jgi:hypothetical protein